MPARRLALAVALVAAGGCAVRVPPAVVDPPARGVAVVFAVGEAGPPCRVEVERLPPAAFALGIATVAREEGRAGPLRAVALELDGTRPVLVLRLAERAGGAAEGAPEPLCAWIKDAAGRLEREAAAPAGAGVAPPWPTDLDPGRVRFRSIQRTSAGGEPTGFAEFAIGARKDGTRALLSRSATLARFRDGWAAIDTVHLEDTDARGVLVRGRYARIAGGLVRYRVEVRRTGARGYAYAGEAREVPVEGAFETADGLFTMLVRIDRFRAGGPAGEVRVEAYEPAVDATRPTAVVHRADPSRPRGVVTQIGSRGSASGVLEPDGVVAWMETASDPPSRVDTLWRAGVP